MNNRIVNNRMNRRQFVALSGSSLIALAGVPIAAAGTDSLDKDAKKRVESTTPKDVKQQFTDEYDAKVAKKAVPIWKQNIQDFTKGHKSEEEALDSFIQELQAESGRFREDVEDVSNESDSGRGSNSNPEDANSGSHSSVTPRVTVGANESVDIALFDGNVGASGLLGYRDGHSYPGQNKVTAICESIAVGDVTQWAELVGNMYIEDGGTYNLVCDYFQNGWIVGGSASYKIWIQEQGSNYKTFSTLKSLGSSVYGNETRSTQFTLDSDTTYDVGVRLRTTISGIAEAISDFQTINADGSTRGLEVNSLTAEPI